MFTENDYKDLSEYVYWVDPKHKLYDPDVKEGIILEGMNSHYNIFNVEDNTANGMQTMAVAPVINDKAAPLINCYFLCWYKSKKSIRCHNKYLNYWP